MADWSMEVPAGQWMPYDLQLANWTTGPADYAVGIPTTEYASTGIFDSICYQTSITICDEEQQCAYEVTTLTDPNQAADQEEYSVEAETPLNVLSDVTNELNQDAYGAMDRMHRYPASIQVLCLDERYTAPKVVAIGPYYHECEHLKQAEKMKYVAVYKCVRETTDVDPDLMYKEFVPVAHKVRTLYDSDVMAGIGSEDFLHMMFLDACFLVQYIFLRGDYHRYPKLDQSLRDFFNANDSDIFRDIMLLENQIPWPVVKSIFDSMAVDGKDKLLKNFIYNHKDCLQDLKRQPDEGKDKFELYHNDNDEYDPPHLLGLLRYYIVGRYKTEPEPLEVDNTISYSVGAVELSQIGIKLNANECCTELVHMGLQVSCIVGCSHELFLAPVTLDDLRASCLISMAAHELCTIPNFRDAKDSESAVCSYLHLLAMLVAREDDVQKLREKNVLLGGGLVDKEVVNFVAKLHDLRLGNCYIRVMKKIADYRREWWLFIRVYSFVYKYRKAILKVVGFAVSSGGLSALIQKFL